MLNLIAIGFLFPLIFLFDQLVALIRPELSNESGITIKLTLPNILIIVVLISGVIILHELIHGLFFWIYTRDRPKFAFKWLYAYAAAPEWYIPRAKFAVVGLSPSLVITICAIFLLLIAPPSFVNYVNVAGIFNVAGSIGDLFVIGWMFMQPKDCLVRDAGDTFSIYIEQENQA